MNYKVVLRILGVAIVVGGTIYFVTRAKSVKSSEESERGEKKSTDVTYICVAEDEDQYSLNNVKADVAETMGERHKEAQKEMKKSVDNIFNGTGSEETKNEEAKKKMFEDLESI